MKYLVAAFLTLWLPVIIGLGLYSIKDKHYGMTKL